MFFAKNIVNLLSKNIDRVGKSIHTPKNCHIRNRYRYIYSGWIDCPFPFFSSKPGNDSYVPSNTTHTTTVTRRRPPTSSIDSRHAYSTSHPTSRGRETFLRWSMKTTTTTTKERRIKKTTTKTTKGRPKYPVWPTSNRHSTPSYSLKRFFPVAEYKLPTSATSIFRASSFVALWHFNSAFGSSRITKPAYPVWPTSNRHLTAGFRPRALCRNHGGFSYSPLSSSCWV